MPAAEARKFVSAASWKVAWESEDDLKARRSDTADYANLKNADIAILGLFANLKKLGIAAAYYRLEKIWLFLIYKDFTDENFLLRFCIHFYDLVDELTCFYVR